MLKITKRGKKAWVTFRLAVDAKSVAIKGSWNNWKIEELKKRKDGSFSITKILQEGEYQFGYLVDGVWQTDATLPTIPSPFGSENSLLRI